MKKADIIAALKKFGDDENIILGDDLIHAYQLKPRAICGGQQAFMSYFCVEAPGHKGLCYCSCKNVEFEPETPEEIEAFIKEVNS
jgi:hypothetical protein